MVTMRKFRQYLATFSCTLSVGMTGACFVWFTPLMLDLMEKGSELPMTPTQMSWIVASIEFGELISPIPAGCVVNRLGRKRLLLASGPLCIVSWILILTTRSIWVMFIVRVIQGIAVGLVYTIGPMYLAEISEPKIRGELTGHFQTMWYAGIMYAYCVGPQLSYQNYAYACAVWPVLFLAMFSFMPESPYFLLMVKRNEKAREALSWLRASKDVEDELKAIRISVDDDMENKGTWRDLVATKRDRMALLVVQVVCSIKYMNGMPAVVSYATATFAQSSRGALTADQLTIVMGGIFLAATFLAAYVVDSIGRRPLLIFSTVGSLIFNFFIGLYYYLEQKTSVDVSGYTWVMYLSVAGYCIVCSLGLGPLLQTIQAEFFPSNTRGLGGAVTGLTSTFTTFIDLKQYQVVVDYFGVYMNFWIFGFFALLGTIILCFILPETKGKSLGEIQTDLKKNCDKSVSVITPSDTYADISFSEKYSEIVEHL